MMTIVEFSYSSSRSRTYAADAERGQPSVAEVATCRRWYGGRLLLPICPRHTQVV